jgi:hypothetical protein
MGTPISHGYLALIAKQDLLPRKTVDELDYYGSFASFVDIV